jgi:hypothetical protein
LPSWLWLGCKTIAPPPKAAGTQQSHQDYAYDRDPEHPANCELRNQDKDEQQNYAGDYEDSGESHGQSVVGWSVVSKYLWSILLADNWPLITGHCFL